jgi:hypothetical protein
MNEEGRNVVDNSIIFYNIFYSSSFFFLLHYIITKNSTQFVRFNLDNFGKVSTELVYCFGKNVFAKKKKKKKRTLMRCTSYCSYIRKRKLQN